MTDQVSGSGTGSAQGQPNNSNQPVTPSQDQRQSVTLDVLNQALNEFGTKIERRIQSLTDRQENRLKKEVDQRLSDLDRRYIAATGQPAPEAVRNQLRDETILSWEEDGSDAQPEAPSNQSVDFKLQSKIRRTQAEMLDLALEANLDPRQVWTLPEFQNFAEEDPDKALAEYKRRMTAALQKRGQPIPESLKNERRESAGPPGSGAPMLTNGSAGSDDLKSEYQRRAGQLKRGSQEMLNLRREMRRRGYDPDRE